MAFDLTLDSPAPRAAVLAAIGEDGREWRESVLPAALRQAGMFQVEATIRGDEFVMHVAGGRERGPPVELRGRVTDRPAGGSRVVARCALRPTYRWLAGLLAFGAVGLAYTDLTGALIVLGVAGLCLAIEWWRDERLTRSGNAEARYLAERLERAVAQAGVAHAG